VKENGCFDCIVSITIHFADNDFYSFLIINVLKCISVVYQFHPILAISIKVYIQTWRLLSPVGAAGKIHRERLNDNDFIPFYVPCRKDECKHWRDGECINLKKQGK
jgi:hypothetical protein